LINGKKVLALVVDDDPDLLQTMGDCLKTAGYDVVLAANGKLAQEQFDKQIVDVVISDVRMPEMNGIELLRHVSKTRPTPFILITGHTDDIEAKEALEFGASTFMAKPFRSDALVSEIQRAMQFNRKNPFGIRWTR
jgi:DNA-binding NtrC family response regulator